MNSQIVETPKSVVIIDVPLLKPYAQAHRRYVESIGKPIEKILVTHAHPDHWFCLSHYQDYRTYAFQEAIDEMNMLKDLAIGYHQSLHADLMPDEVILPADTIEAGPLVVDGIDFNIYKVTDAEATCMMAIDAPAANTFLPQDLVYNRRYPYVATKTRDGDPTVDSWIAHLIRFRDMGYDTVIPGHGEPTDPAIFDEMIAYLTYAGEVLETAKDGDEFIQHFKTAYPDYRIDITLTMVAFMLYEFEG